MEPVFRGIEIAAKAVVVATGTRITYQGLEHIPDTGGAVIAINHTAYVDFLPAGLAATHRRRRVRFMLKAEVQQVPMGNFLVKQAGLIPVDRSSGGDAYPIAVERLRAGELVGVYPEATISRSFELKEFKTGVARMALDAQVPIIPVIVWGVHRVWTKDHPKRLGRKKIPVIVRVGAPITSAAGPVAEVMAMLQQTMTDQLHAVQEEYPHPAGEYWVPRRLGGGAPTPEEAEVLEKAERARREAGGH
ncbi:lysophospholipid acyltransferase family protein [Mycolicibacterium aubagnense]|uniref:1-acyl-sn-glycerol-3-phosphate acyltransferase n=1 Tax=Mycolicibacterium aubagnense TaxID=319707 RepID=A0ABM7IES0_9MYCO|nr:lysophospholipid acyltransferase family protein [Mycolicibacterium aubagnense]TLH49451.1 1-acyl-sn-glycerol-3-phosphate acyltransferase [Mycolicibacterium aubagnense]WGI33142.1 lysophospholipid acyltransferase family protein [Mycolicibacterium aubagnense]BBX85156.1 1-acyl-sn-glycerol-3-phosphate acyltransferase [Mycolicibacterium aubagnense]